MRNESAEDFLSLLKEWEKLCIRFSLVNNDDAEKVKQYPFDEDAGGEDDEEAEEEEVDDLEVFEVGKILEICFGDPNQTGKSGLFFKVFTNHVIVFFSFKFCLINYVKCMRARKVVGHMHVICGINTSYI